MQYRSPVTDLRENNAANLSYYLSKWKEKELEHTCIPKTSKEQTSQTDGIKILYKFLFSKEFNLLLNSFLYAKTAM